MEFATTALRGVWVLRSVDDDDERGSFARTFCAAEFREHGIDPHVEQCSRSRNSKAGTLRGLHVQREPHGETKLIRCTRGAAFDVLLDARAGSRTFGRWEAFELRDDGELALYAPAGVAHGYQTLRDETVLHYLLSAPYAAEAAAGFRYDSPSLAIPWPLPVSAISERDRALPPFTPSGVDT